jgi:hypothetical protein
MDARQPRAHLTERDSNMYSAWSKALERTLRQLGLKPSKGLPTAATFADFLRE